MSMIMKCNQSKKIKVISQWGEEEWKENIKEDNKNKVNGINERQYKRKENTGKIFY